MKRLIPFILLLLPAALFAQGFKDQETTLLKGFGLNDSQVSQVFDIQSKTRAAVKQDRVQIQLLHAQMEKALLPASPNMQDVNGYITQISQARADMMKTLVGARVQLRQIIGDDNFPAYTRFLRRAMGFDRPALLRMHQRALGDWGQGPGGMMGGPGPMMGDRPFDDGGPSGDGPADDGASVQ